MRERLLRGVYPEQCECAPNDNIQYAIKGMACVIARVFSEAISRFHNGELVAASLCQVIKTDLKENEADRYLVHDRYKDLTEVERVFRECTTVNLEVRPVYTRKEESTRRACVCGNACVPDNPKAP